MVAQFIGILAFFRVHLGNALTPPFRRDTLGTFRSRHDMVDAPPAELPGRSLGNLGCHDFDRLRNAEQADRTLRFHECF
jgi:hypothetical protein